MNVNRLQASIHLRMIQPLYTNRTTQNSEYQMNLQANKVADATTDKGPLNMK